MFLKLAYSSMRNKLTAFIQFVTPIINISISVVIARSWKFMSQLPPLTLSLMNNSFDTTQTLMSQASNLSDNSLEANAMRQFKDNFKNSRDSNTILTDIGTMDIGKFYLKLVSTTTYTFHIAVGLFYIFRAILF